MNNIAENLVFILLAILIVSMLVMCFYPVLLFGILTGVSFLGICFIVAIDV